MKSCTLVTTSGMITQGFEMQVGFRDHAGLHHLGLDLPEPGLQPVPARLFRDQGFRLAALLGDEVAGADEELLDAAIDASTDESLVEVHLRLRLLRLGARPLGRQAAWRRATQPIPSTAFAASTPDCR